MASHYLLNKYLSFGVSLVDTRKKSYDVGDFWERSRKINKGFKTGRRKGRAFERLIFQELEMSIALARSVYLNLHKRLIYENLYMH